jgi:hypothetical protein
VKVKVRLATLLVAMLLLKQRLPLKVEPAGQLYKVTKLTVWFCWDLREESAVCPYRICVVCY